MITKYPIDDLPAHERALVVALLQIANHSGNVSGAPLMVGIATDALIRAGVVSDSRERRMGELLPANA